MRLAKLSKTRVSWLTLGTGLFVAGLNLAHASPFLPTYAGPHDSALTLNSINATFNGSVFDLSSTSAAPISSAPPGSLYVWGINRGAGTARFFTSPPTAASPDIGSNVLFDAVFLINPDGTGVVNLFNGHSPEIVPASDIRVSGNTINALLPLSFLPGTGAAPQSYSFDLWPRVGAGQNNQIAQFFGTSNSINPINVQAAMVPEPPPWTMLATGLGLFILLRRPKLSQPCNPLSAIHYAG
ncbi:MAG: hypothetical protein ACYCSS_00025 [Sulfuriferula sp.]